MAHHVIASSRKWHNHLPAMLGPLTGDTFELITRQDDLTVEHLSRIRPQYVFFPHWSYIIPADVFTNFKCVVFHMTDLPFGRGGSPLQNLIAMGIYETKISALQCQSGIDTGAIYMKEQLSLHGTAEEIYLRAADIIGKMILSIIKNNPTPIPQKGEVVQFKRRTPNEGNIAAITDLRKIYDFIRMLDADGYPAAFIETEHARFEFTRPSLKSDKIMADVIITAKKGSHE